MSAIERIRAMLDVRGVEHYDGTETTLWLKDGIGYRASADEGLNGYIHLHLWCTTPEQAIAATLGSCNCPNNCTNGERTETCADGGTVSETCIRPAEEGSICPIPRVSVIFEGQKLTFDVEDSERFAKLLERHLRKLAGVEVAE